MIFIFILSTTFALSQAATSPSCNKVDYKRLDLMFLLDGSGSVGRKNFPKVLEFVKKVVGRLPISAQDTAVGVIQYSFVAKRGAQAKSINEVTLNAVQDRDRLMQKIGKIKYIKGGTDAAEAMSAGYKQFKIHGRKGAPKAMVIITDGLSKTEVKAAADRMRLSGITIISVGVGRAVRRQLLEMAGDASRVFSVDKFSEMVKFVDGLAKTIQKAVNPACYYEPEATLTASPRGPYRVGQKITLEWNSNGVLLKNGEPVELNQGQLSYTLSWYMYDITANARTAGVYECRTTSSTGIVTYSQKIYILKEENDDNVESDEVHDGTDVEALSIEDLSARELCKRCPSDRCTVYDGDQCTKQYIDCWNMASPVGLQTCPTGKLFTVENIARNISGNCWSAEECRQQKLRFW